eukprot:COSAG05_NODE_2963_length_2459_cov_2.922458_2_plen_135_part_00
MYGFGTPILFGAILFSAGKDELQTHEFTERYGFLSTKMKAESFWWGIVVSFRKLFLSFISSTRPGVSIVRALSSTSTHYHLGHIGLLDAPVYNAPELLPGGKQHLALQACAAIEQELEDHGRGRRQPGATKSKL